jgi:dTMP kinase
VTRGAFIVFEGIDGSGKTTMARRLWSAIGGIRRARGASEPFATDELEALHHTDRSDPTAMALWFAYDRTWLVRSSIRPNTMDGFHVICDRYVWSSLAYQGADGVDLDWLREINRYAPEPDFTVYLDVPVAVAVNRIQHRENRLVPSVEAMRLAIIGNNYAEIAGANRNSVAIIDASRDEGAVFADVLAAVERFLATFDGERPL